MAESRLAHQCGIDCPLCGRHRAAREGTRSSQKGTGLAAVSGQVGWQPISLWHQASILPHFSELGYLQKGTPRAAALMTYAGGGGGGGGEDSIDRKLVRTVALTLVVQSTAPASG